MKQFVQHHVKHPQPNLETKCSHTTFFVAGFSLSPPPTYYVHLVFGDNFIILFNFYLMALSHFNTNGHDHAPIMFYERSRKPEQHNRSLNVRTNALCRPACLFARGFAKYTPKKFMMSLWCVLSWLLLLLSSFTTLWAERYLHHHHIKPKGKFLTTETNGWMDGQTQCEFSLRIEDKWKSIDDLE